MATTTETAAVAGFGTLLLAGVMLVAGLTYRIEQRMIASDQRLKVKEATTWVDAPSSEYSCYANRSDITCTFTNKLPTAATTCVQGTLTPNAANGVTLKSLTICSGRLLPLETKNVTAPWVGGFADDLCYKENQYGKQLDWSKCVFNTGAVDLRASIVPQ